MSVIDVAIYGKIQRLSDELKPLTPEERKELEDCKNQIENYEAQISAYENTITEKDNQIATYKEQSDEYREQANLYESVLTGTVTEFTIPADWKEIRRGAFNDCSKLVSVTMSNNIEIIGVTAFNNCINLKSLYIPASVTTIRDNAFYNCKSLTDLSISNSVVKLGNSVFVSCSELINVTLGNGFNCNGLNISASTKYSVDTLVAMLTALADRTGETAYTLTLGATNLEKLSDEQKAIATDKNWTLA